MYPTPDEPYFYVDQTAASSKGGCLSGFLLPPLAVLIVGAILTVVLINVSPSTTSPVKAASLNQSISVTQTTSIDIPQPSAGITAGSPGEISPIFMPEVQYWSSEIKGWATEAGLDPNLVATVMQIESCGYEKATSRAGAMGLFQVMPFHFSAGEDTYDPNVNAAHGLAYLKRSLQAANGDIRLALAGYNGGIGVINQPESSWSNQTRNYVAAGTRIYTKASSSNITAEDVQQWTSNVTALCRQAAAAEGINP